MKKLKLIGFTLILLVCFFGCSNDSVTEKETKNENLDQSRQNGEVTYMDVLITFKKKVSEQDKQTTRDYYTNQGVLINWDRCKKDKKSEVWYVRCQGDSISCRQGNPPVNPDKPIPGQTERMLYFADCSDL